jgi:Zn-dependent protease
MAKTQVSRLPEKGRADMPCSLRLGRIAGIDVRVHATFFLLLVWIAVGYHVEGGPGAAARGVTFTMLVMGCVVLHEFGHAFAARGFGIPTHDITLLPIGGVARLARMPEDPRQELVIATAGPAVNVLIAAGLILIGHDLDLTRLLQVNSGQPLIGQKLLAVNVFLVLFNLLPAFPMDGGRVLRALLAFRMNYVRATQLAASVGQSFALLFGVVGLFTNPMLLFVALFVYLGAEQEAAVAHMRSVTSRLPISAATLTDVRSLPLEAPLRAAADLLLRTAQHIFPVVDATGRLRGILTRDSVMAGLTRGYSGPVAELMHPDVPTVSSRASLHDAFQIMNDCKCPGLAVLDDAGGLVGIVTPDNVREMVMVHDALAKHPRAA